MSAALSETHCIVSGYLHWDVDTLLLFFVFSTKWFIYRTQMKVTDSRLCFETWASCPRCSSMTQAKNLRGGRRRCSKCWGVWGSSKNFACVHRRTFFGGGGVAKKRIYLKKSVRKEIQEREKGKKKEEEEKKTEKGKGREKKKEYVNECWKLLLVWLVKELAITLVSNFSYYLAIIHFHESACRNVCLSKEWRWNCEHIRFM